MKKTHGMRLFAAILCSLLAGPAASCTPSVISFRQDMRINDALESLQPLPGYEYYYSGPDSFPLAILGVSQGLAFRQGLWKKVNLTEAKLDLWMRSIDNRYRSISTRYSGKYIIGPKGRVLGIWYSPQEWPAVRLSAEDELSVVTPPNSLYEKIIGNADSFP